VRLAVLLLLCASACAQVRVGVAGGMPIGMGHKAPQGGFTVSYETARFEFSGSLLSAGKLDGGWGVSGVNSAKVCLKRVDLGVRHSWLKVEHYGKQAVRPFIALGQHDLNFKYIWWGTDRQNKLQAALFEIRRPINEKWRFGFEAGPTFFHATNDPSRRQFGVAMAFGFERRLR
jgi:hypothetical protein